MKLTYSISLDDYRGGHRPFATKAGANAGFKGMLIFCALLAGLGVFTFIKDMGVPVSAFLVGLATVCAVGAYAYDKHSVETAKKKYEAGITAGYQRMHCRDQRSFEANEAGFSASCRCGTVTRPWSELTSFSESAKLMMLSTKMGPQILPKPAFDTPADVTEFRVLMASKLNADRLVSSRHIEFACGPGDFRQARWLHILKGGGWRAEAKRWGRLAIVTFGAWAIWNSTNRRNPFLLCGLVGGFLAALILPIVRERRVRYFGPLKIHFSDESLHLQDLNTQARRSWSQFIGYLENDDVLLLYYNPNLYRIVPQRALKGTGAEFRTIATSKLRRYDYRQPLTSAATAVPDSA